MTDDDREVIRLTTLYLKPAADALAEKVHTGEPLTVLEARVLSWIINSPRPDRLRPS